MQNGHFISPTYGKCDLSNLRKRIVSYLAFDPKAQYRLVIGTDSQPKNGSATDFVTALIIHRVGSGGIYFWKRIVEAKQYVLRQRMYQEAAYSLTAAEEFLALFKRDGITKYDVEIHVDIGQKGETRVMIGEIVGMIRGSGFAVKTKPDSFGASKVADRHT
jgi:predicted RNase H-related nuclease YkuK (DUF458 family)